VNITKFIADRLDEDEAAARAAQGTRWGQCDHRMNPYVIHDVDVYRPTIPAPGRIITAESPETRAHIARHDPARVLREITAKRRVLDRHCRSEDDTVTDYCTACTSGDYAGYPDVELDDCPELQDIAYIWNDHSDWNQRWCPHVEGRHEADVTELPPARRAYTNACNRCGQGDGWHYKGKSKLVDEQENKCHTSCG